MLFSTVLLSISVTAMCLFSLLEFENKKISFNKSVIVKSAEAIRNKGYWAFPLLFLYIFINPYGGNDTTYLIERIQIKFPFLILPFAFLNYNNVDRRTISTLFTILLFLIIGIQLYSLNPFIGNADAYQELLRTGRSIETPGNHIRFSLLSAFVILGNIHFSLSKLNSRFYLLAWAFIIVSILLLHLMGVRTGLLIFYTGIIAYGTFMLIHKQRYKLLITTSILILLLPYFSYNFNNGFKNKIDYMFYDIQQFKEGKGQDFADSGRLVSLSVGYQLWRNNMIFGVGMSNMRPSVKDAINASFPGYHSNLLPHNQFLFVLVSSGSIGFLMFLSGLIIPWIIGKLYKHAYLFMMFICFAITLMIDHLFEGTVGVISYLLLLLIGSVDFQSD
jgi:O-antigen ligase